MKKILLTAFTPFDGDSINPSEELLKFYQTKDSKHSMSFLLLPVTFEESFKLISQKLAIESYDCLIMTGVAKNRKKISLEKMGINWIDARIPDNNGQLITASRILPNEERDGVFTTIPIEQMLNTVKDPSIEISYSAGSFVCNFVYFSALVQIKCPSLFIHLPGTVEMTGDQNMATNQEIFNSIFNFIELSF